MKLRGEKCFCELVLNGLEMKILFSCVFFHSVTKLVQRIHPQCVDHSSNNVMYQARLQTGFSQVSDLTGF